MRVRLLLGLALSLALGCSSQKFAPVSGKVTLNGKALANATVSFQPIAPPKKMEAAPGSAGKTNENGEYTLKLTSGEKGAWVGKHQVRISALNPEIGEGDARPPRGGWPLADKVPKQYNAETTLTFEVPAGGTNAANFDLKSP